MRCRKCSHLFLSRLVEGVSALASNLWEYYAARPLQVTYLEWLSSKITTELPEKDTKQIVNTKLIILEIGCANGSLLDQFKAKGWDTYGVDARAETVAAALSKGHSLELGAWVGGSSFTHLPPPDELDVILAQILLDRVPHPVDFLKACK